MLTYMVCKVKCIHRCDLLVQHDLNVQYIKLAYIHMSVNSYKTMTGN